MALPGYVWFPLRLTSGKRLTTHADILRCYDAAIAMAEAHKPRPTVRPD